MFSIFSKAWIQLLAALHDLMDSFSDAGRTARQGIRELDNEIRESEESITAVAAELILMRHEREKAEEASIKWDRAAKIAKEGGDHEAAIKALQYQVQAEELANNYQDNVTRIDAMLVQLKSRLSELRDKKLELQNRTSLLDARSKVAKAESRAARYLGNIGNSSGVDLDALEKQVDRKEAKAAALVEMAQEKTTNNVDKRLQEYDRREALNAKMQALGLLTADQTKQPVSLLNNK